jgi:hypothetical protein
MEGIGMTTPASTRAQAMPEPAEERSSVLDSIRAPHISATVPVSQEDARVVDVTGDRVTVRVAGRDREAQRAVSCLVAPEKDDRVLVALLPDGVFILAVLSRSAGAATTVSSASGDLKVHVPAGRLSFATRDGIDMATQGEVRIAAQELGASVGRAKVYAEEIVVLGSKALVEVATAKLKGSTLESVFERTLARVKRSFRTVEEIDSLRAGDIDYKAEQNLGLRSQTTVMTAKELIKADAEQIHFG